MKTLQFRGAELSSSEKQIATLESCGSRQFEQKLRETGLFPLRSTSLQTLQINLGKLCNQVCVHCHVDAGPDRTEIMTRQTMEQCLTALAVARIPSVDLTGGAPEMNPDFRWFVGELRTLGAEITVRCNLTILLAGKAYEDLPQFFAQHRIHVVSSLPCYSKKNVEEQRGIGVFNKSIEALKRLNAVGYGKPETGLKLDLVYNPNGAFLPPSQRKLEDDYRRELRALFGIEFSHLLALANLPVSRFLDYLLESGKLESYHALLLQAYNPKAAAEVMCRSLLSVGWDGQLYDCDFNQMLEKTVMPAAHRHISQFDVAALTRRPIYVNEHCFGCTAGEGSSCGGATLA